MWDLQTNSQKVPELGNDGGKNMHQEELMLLKQGTKDCVRLDRGLGMPLAYSIVKSEELLNSAFSFMPADC